MIAIIITIALIILALFYGILTYKKLLFLRNTVNKSWNELASNINLRFNYLAKFIVLMQRVINEKSLLQKAANALSYARESQHKGTIIFANNELNKIINDLFLLYEKYDIAKIDEEKIYLNLNALSEKILVLRQDYNLAVKNYNDKVNLYPSKIIALIGRFKPDMYYEVNVSMKKKEIESL